jgi:lipopolysaccharide transport protein LptA
VRWGRSRLTADRVAAHLDPQDQRLQFLRARWGLRAVLVDEDEAGNRRNVLAEGDSLSMLLDEQGRTPTRLELEGVPGTPAHLRRGIPATGEAFDVVAARVHGDLQGGRLSTVAASGGVTLVNEAPGGDRQLTARDVTAQFAGDGTLAQLEATGEVRMAAADNVIVGDRVVVTPERSEAFGEPVVLTSRRGELRAPRIVYTPESKLAHALGGVEATLVEEAAGALRRTPIAAGEEPVRVQAAEAFWREQPQSFLFRGEVRAWSGDRVLRAEQLRGESEQERLAASGQVETVWFTPPGEGDTGGAATPRQVRIHADTLIYDQRASILLYEGGVRVVDGQRTLASRKLEVTLDEEGEARRLLATGEVVLAAPEEGRTITAASADHDLQAQQVVFLGTPVTLKDAKGGTLNGAQAVYSLESGKVRVTGAAEPLPTPPATATPQP